jgi:hypothetical protein
VRFTRSARARAGEVPFVSAIDRDRVEAATSRRPLLPRLHPRLGPSGPPRSPHEHSPTGPFPLARPRLTYGVPPRSPPLNAALRLSLAVAPLPHWQTDTPARRPAPRLPSALPRRRSCASGRLHAPSHRLPNDGGASAACWRARFRGWVSLCSADRSADRRRHQSRCAPPRRAARSPGRAPAHARRPGSTPTTTRRRTGVLGYGRTGSDRHRSGSGSDS